MRLMGRGRFGDSDEAARERVPKWKGKRSPGLEKGWSWGNEDDRRGWWCSELAAAAAAAAGRLHASNERTRRGEAAVSAAGTAAARGGAAAVAAAEAAVGLLPCSSLSSHLRGMIILSFFK